MLLLAGTDEPLLQLGSRDLPHPQKDIGGRPGEVKISTSRVPKFFTLLVCTFSKIYLHPCR